MRKIHREEAHIPIYSQIQARTTKDSDFDIVVMENQMISKMQAFFKIGTEIHGDWIEQYTSSWIWQVKIPDGSM